MKAVLVIDMPETCSRCPCCDYVWWYCGAAEKAFDTKEETREKIADWCPLKPMAEYEEIMNRIHRLEKEYFE